MTDNVRIHYDGTHHTDAVHHPSNEHWRHPTAAATADLLTSLDDDPAWARYIPDSGPLENA